MGNVNDLRRESYVDDGDGWFAQKMDPVGWVWMPSDSVTSETSYWQTSAPGSSSEYSRWDHTHGTPPIPTASQVWAVSDSATIKINGEIQNLSDSPDFTISTWAGASAANVYLQSTASPVVGTYKDLSYSLEPATTTLSVVVNNNEVKVADFLFPLQVDTDIIDVGTWNFHFHAYASSTVWTTKLRYVPFKRSAGGTETDLFSLTSSEINSTSPDLYVDSISQNFYNTDQTDRMGLRLYASTTHNANVTVTVLVGDGEASLFNAPIALRHSQLRGRNEANAHPASAISQSLSSTLLGTTVQSSINALSPKVIGVRGSFNLGWTETNNRLYYFTASGDKTVGADPTLFPTAFRVGFKNLASTSITIDAWSGNTIDGTQTFVVDSLLETVWIVKNGTTSWIIESNNVNPAASVTLAEAYVANRIFL